MMPITLKQFLKTYNFRCTQGYDENGEIIYDTRIIRIYYGTDYHQEWFEFGEYDYDSGGVWARAKCVLSKSILDMVVKSFHYDDEKNVFCVYLERDDMNGK